jgi:site-specific DNA recombinase
MSTRIRCAVYTRKSTDEGLEQDFNSLDAQREACEAFIQSQRGLGWVTVAKRYDDGGFSGGTMERPALQALMSDIEKGKVDLIVVYKVDRLTRSLADFSKIVEIFESRDVSFVSVTQQFNTSTSMGRLTLNVLLSFAQFEREVTGERIRDKIAASKKKGMWMGGLPPLGYDTDDKQLVVNHGEAETVRTIFRLYLEFGSVRDLKNELDRQGLVTKRRASTSRMAGGRSFTRGNLYQLLRNPIYIGEVRHRGQTYPGQHRNIVDKKTWDAVQRMLEGQASSRRSAKNIKQACLLTGLIYDETGERLSPTFCVKDGRRYRYYISKRLVHEPGKDDEGWRLPAGDLENAVKRAISDFLQDQQRLIDTVRAPEASPAYIQSILKSASDLAGEIASDAANPKLQDLIQRVTIDKATIKIELSKSRLSTLITDSADEEDEPNGLIHLEIPMEIRRRGVESKIILQGDGPMPDVNLVNLVASTRGWFDHLAKGKAPSIREVARQTSATENDISRFLQLAFLAPDIVEAILAGKHPPDLTAEKLKRLKCLPPSWEDQRNLLGFTPSFQAQSGDKNRPVETIGEYGPNRVPEAVSP